MAIKTCVKCLKEYETNYGPQKYCQNPCKPRKTLAEMNASWSTTIPKKKNPTEYIKFKKKFWSN